VTDAFDVVAVGIEDIAAVVVGVVPTQTGWPLSVPPASIAAAWKASTRLSALSAMWRRPRTGSPWASMKKDGLPPSSLPNPAAASENSIKSFSPSGASAFS
jgi:hypothetical protein